MTAKIDETTARKIFEDQYPDPELRKTVLGIFAERSTKLTIMIGING